MSGPTCPLLFLVPMSAALQTPHIQIFGHSCVFPLNVAPRIAQQSHRGAEMVWAVVHSVSCGRCANSWNEMASPSHMASKLASYASRAFFSSLSSCPFGRLHLDDGPLCPMTGSGVGVAMAMEIFLGAFFVGAGAGAGQAACGAGPGRGGTWAAGVAVPLPAAAAREQAGETRVGGLTVTAAPVGPITRVGKA